MNFSLNLNLNFGLIHKFAIWIIQKDYLFYEVTHCMLFIAVQMMKTMETTISVMDPGYSVFVFSSFYVCA